MADNRCGATVWAGTRCGQQCRNRARFVYKVVQGSQEYLCGVHAKHLRHSRDLTELTRNQGSGRA